MGSRWPELTVVERRRSIGRLIEEIVVARGASAVEVRASVVPRGPDGPMLPPFAAPRWDEHRIEGELRAFATEGWPDDEAFSSAGRGPLLAQIHATGAPSAGRCKSRITDAPTCSRGYSTDQRIHAALAAVLEGRRTWPTRREFAALGYEGLYGAMARRGRPAWERDLGFDGHRALDRGERARRDGAAHLQVRELPLPRGLPSRRPRRPAPGDSRPPRRPRPVGRSPGPAAQRAAPASQDGPALDRRARRGSAARTRRHDRYPLQREFVAAGEGGLYRQIKKTVGHASWARRLDLPRATERRVAR